MSNSLAASKDPSIPESQKVWVVIPAAGVGKRMKTDTPKQYLTINKKTVLEHTLNCFINHPEVSGIVIALHTEDPYWNSLNISKNMPSDKAIYTVEGGHERSDSVLQALDYLLLVEKAPESSWVMVHDAARPLLSRVDLDKLLEIRHSEELGGILASPVRDTMKRAQVDSSHAKKSQADNKAIRIERTEPRENLWHALTPQLFKLGELNHALKTCFEKGLTITDEASAIEAMGKHPMLVEGSSNNIKITQPADFELAELMLTKLNQMPEENT